MWDEVFGVALTNGIFACLFVALLVYELKDSRQREKKYQKTIETLTSRLVTIEKIHEDVDEIKQTVILKRRKKSNENV